MKKEEKKVNFDLSALKLGELIRVYEDIDAFIEHLQDKLPEEETKEEVDE